MHSIQKHQEGGSKPLLRRRGQVGPLLELVTQRQPFLLYQYSEAFECSIVGVEADLR